MNVPMPEWSGNILALKNNKNITFYNVICGTDNVVYDTLIGYLCSYIYGVNLLNKTEYVDNPKIKQDLIPEPLQKSIVIQISI